ncbi:uncharacterized protein LOC143187477 [Calliopsis andreniformis]|uniref:uncharacterized protein LOC143187477 n=1 Tax=Calliopsis andreniformis TaxID=337506 RepID=UPI003FCC67F6
MYRDPFAIRGMVISRWKARRCVQPETASLGGIIDSRNREGSKIKGHETQQLRGCTRKMSRKWLLRRERRSQHNALHTGFLHGFSLERHECRHWPENPKLDAFGTPALQRSESSVANTRYKVIACCARAPCTWSLPAVLATKDEKTVEKDVFGIDSADIF